MRGGVSLNTHQQGSSGYTALSVAYSVVSLHVCGIDSSLVKDSKRTSRVSGSSVAPCKPETRQVSFEFFCVSQNRFVGRGLRRIYPIMGT